MQYRSDWSLDNALCESLKFFEFRLIDICNTVHICLLWLWSLLADQLNRHFKNRSNIYSTVIELWLKISCCGRGSTRPVSWHCIPGNANDSAMTTTRQGQATSHARGIAYTSTFYWFELQYYTIYRFLTRKIVVGFNIKFIAKGNESWVVRQYITYGQQYIPTLYFNLSVLYKSNKVVEGTSNNNLCHRF